MKKLVWLIVCLMTMVFCSCTGNKKTGNDIEGDVDKALKQLDLFVNQCGGKYYRTYAEFDYKNAKKNDFDKLQKDLKDSLKIRAGKDAEEIAKKVFDKLFDEYEEVELINQINTKFNEIYYKVSPIKDKNELYDRIYTALYGEFITRALDGIETFELNLRTEMLKRY